jgi:hypothetical protein
LGERRWEGLHKMDGWIGLGYGKTLGMGDFYFYLGRFGY